jgi:hypothetical protein
MLNLEIRLVRVIKILLSNSVKPNKSLNYSHNLDRKYVLDKKDVHYE